MTFMHIHGTLFGIWNNHYYIIESNISYKTIISIALHIIIISIIKYLSGY